ncbi:MAG: AIR synthase family protein [Clostridiales bacterium]|jgi:hydrogenase maturation factor|nr:AIR synthase family protein [Clostridiales bacterium]
MRLGKLSNSQLSDLVLGKYKQTRPEVRSMPKVGEDCAVIDLGGDLVVLSTDPITSTAGNLGTLSVHINCNDAAAAGATPVGLLVTLLAPPTATEEEIAVIAEELSAAARTVGVDILGGHTEVTDSVTRYLTSTAVIARLPHGRQLGGMQGGNDIVLTKWAGLEGSALIAMDYAARLPMLDDAQLRKMRGLMQHLSVVPEGLYAAAHGATAMHDVTEGGVYGAAWEMAFAAGTGITLFKEQIPVLPETRLICDALGIDPMRLISSGCMLIACADGEAMTEGLGALSIPAAVIGIAGGEGLRLSDGSTLDPPEADELYKLS